MAGEKGFKRRITLEFNYDQVKEGTQNVAHQMKILNAEYKASKAEALALGDGTKTLSLRHDYLKERIKIVNAELGTYQERLNKAVEVQGEGSKSAQKYYKEVETTEAELRKLKAELEQVNQKLDEQEGFLGKSADQWKETGKKISDVGSSLTKRITLPAAAAGAAAFKLAGDYEQAIGKMEVVFAGSTQEINAWADNSLKKMGLARTTAIAMVADYGAMANSLGVESKKALEISTGLAEKVRDLASFYNATTAEASEALKSIFTGSTEPMRKFGVVMTDAALNSYALSKGIHRTTREMSEAEKVQLRYNYVMDATAQATGQFKREQNDAATQTETFKEVVKELGVNFGKVLLPAITPILQTINTGLTAISNMDESSRKFILTAIGLAATLGPLLIIIGKTVTAVANASKAIKAARKAGGVFATAVSASQGFGMGKWKFYVLGIIAVITVLLALIVTLTGKSNDLRRNLQVATNTAKSFNAEASRAQKIGSHAVGTKFVRSDQVSMLHEGEAVIPADKNPWNPSVAHNDSEPFGSFGAGGSGDTFILQVKMDEVNEVQKLLDVVNGLKQKRRARYGT